MRKLVLVNSGEVAKENETTKHNLLICKKWSFSLKNHIKMWTQFEHASEITFLQVRSGYGKRNRYRHVTQLGLLKFFTLRFFRLPLRKHCRRPLGRYESCTRNSTKNHSRPLGVASNSQCTGSHKQNIAGVGFTTYYNDKNGIEQEFPNCICHCVSPPLLRQICLTPSSGIVQGVVGGTQLQL